MRFAGLSLVVLLCASCGERHGGPGSCTGSCGEGYELYVHESWPDAFTRYGDEVLFLGSREEVGTLWAFDPAASDRADPASWGFDLGGRVRALHTSDQMWAPPSALLMAVIGDTLYFEEYTRLLERVAGTTSVVFDFSTLGESANLLGLRAAGDWLYIRVSRGVSDELWSYHGEGDPEKLFDDPWATCTEGDTFYFSSSTEVEPGVTENRLMAHTNGELRLFGRLPNEPVVIDQHCVALGGSVYLNVEGELWRVSSDFAGAITPGKLADFELYLPGERAYFKSHNWGPRELWSVGVAGDLRSEIDLPGELFAAYDGGVLSADYDGLVYFTRDGVTTVLEGWPTPDFFYGHGADEVRSVVIDNTLVFRGHTLTTGMEPFVWTGSGTPRLIEDLYPGCECVVEEFD